MEPTKFEDHLREKLEAREIQPSKEAWNKLEARLSEEKSSGTKGYWWAIAAGFIGILIVSTVFFQQNNKTEIVETNSLEKVEDNIEKVQNTTEVASEELPQKSVINEENVTESQVKLNNTEKQNNVAEAAGTLNRPKSRMENNVLNQNSKTSETIIAAVSEENKKTKGAISLIASEEKDEALFIENKVSEVVASVKQLQENNTTITAEEVDALLANAQREIATQRILNQSKVDAAALLEDVEMELEQNFRERVFEMLGDGFQKIRTAVVDRNQ